MATTPSSSTGVIVLSTVAGRDARHYSHSGEWPDQQTANRSSICSNESAICSDESASTFMERPARAHFGTREAVRGPPLAWPAGHVDPVNQPSARDYVGSDRSRKNAHRCAVVRAGLPRLTGATAPPCRYRVIVYVTSTAGRDGAPWSSRRGVCGAALKPGWPCDPTPARSAPPSDTRRPSLGLESGRGW